MNILIPVAMYWIVLIVFVIFLVHVTIGIITKQYEKHDTDTKLDEILTILKNRLPDNNDKQIPKP